MAEPRWRVRLATAAKLDFADILGWTKDNFGTRQARLYRDTILRAIGELASGPNVPGSRARDGVLAGVRTLHVARHGRHGRHFLVHRVADGWTIEIARILHDRRDHLDGFRSPCTTRTTR